MKYRNGAMIAADALKLYTHHWETGGDTKGHIYIAHGWAEHGKRYDEVARFWVSKGYNVHAVDHRGHGRSQGVRGHVDRWLDYARDLHQLVEQTDDGLPRYLLGHSMGGMIALTYVLAYPASMHRLLLSGPLADLSLPVPLWKDVLGRALSSIAPKFTMPNNLPPESVCNNPATVAAYQADPLVHNKVSTRWFTEFNEVAERVKKQAKSIKVPTAIWHGADDTVVEPWVSENLFEALQCKKQRTVVDGASHEILFEIEWQPVAEQMMDWIEAAD